jgi:Zn-dependent protease with chaperone function/Tfp pilus assembly protein PilF
MNRVCRVLVVCLLIGLVLVLPVDAQGGEGAEERDPVFEQDIYDRLAEINPEAAPIFQEATRAMDAGDLTSARQGYEQVLALAPEFPDAVRRLSYVYNRLGDAQTALRYAEQAYAIDPSPYNQLAVAGALLGVSQDADKVGQALLHAKAAAQALPEDPAAHYALFYAGLMNEDVEACRQASATLKQVAHTNPMTHYAAAIVATFDSDWKEAKRALSLAEELGMPVEETRGMRQAIDAALRKRRWMLAGAYTFGGWLVSPVLLLFAGVLLSRATLDTVRRTQATAQFQVGRAERTVRALYRGVIALTSAYFYVSLPLLALIVLAGAAGIFYLFSLLGSIPIRLALGLIVAVFLTLYAVLRGLFVRVREREPGRALEREEAPGLWSLAEQVAQRLGTRPIEAIYVTPAPTIAVTERGRLWLKPRAGGQRCLILGLGALSGMTQGQFTAILAHEYGHFSNRDTAGGDLAYRVNAAVQLMAYSLASGGQARWYNPVWLFLNGFHRLFTRVTRGASRLQEVLADRYAAIAYGARGLITGLTQLIRQSLAFNVRAGHEIDAALDREQGLPNLFALPPPQDDELREQLEAEIAKEMSRATSPYDSHLAPGERIALLERIEADGPPDENATPVWDLMADAEALQAEMMQVIQGNVEQRLASAGGQDQVPPQTDVRRPWYQGPRVRSWAALLMILGGFVVIAWGVSISSVPGMLLGGLFAVIGIWIRYGDAIRARIRARVSGKKDEGQSGDSG